jgi:hypothetical protein
MPSRRYPSIRKVRSRTRARPHFGLGRRNEAIGEYKKALALEPDLLSSIEGLKGLAKISLDFGGAPIGAVLP